MLEVVKLKDVRIVVRHVPSCDVEYAVISMSEKRRDFGSIYLRVMGVNVVENVFESKLCIKHV